MLTRATERPPSVLASFGVFALWLAGAALVVAAKAAPSAKLGTFADLLKKR